MASDYTPKSSTYPLGDNFYIESTLPVAVTLAQYRASRPRRPNAWRRLRQLAGSVAVTPATAAA
jgi:hypothetical protein